MSRERTPEAEAARADEYRDSLRDLVPVPTYQHVPVTREQILAACRNDPIDCGKQTMEAA